MECLFSHPVPEDDELARAHAMSFGSSESDTKDAVPNSNVNTSAQQLEEEKVQFPSIDELLSTCTKLLMKEPLAFPVRDLLVMICSQDDDPVACEAVCIYEKSRMRYYFALVECDSSATADHIYKENDGVEFEHSSNPLDLRFILDNMDFKQPPKDVATETPANYENKDFYSRAFQHSKVELTWDEDEPARANTLKRKSNDEQLAQLEMDELVASNVSESDDSEDDNEIDGHADKKARKKKAMYINLVRNNSDDDEEEGLVKVDSAKPEIQSGIESEETTESEPGDIDSDADQDQDQSLEFTGTGTENMAEYHACQTLLVVVANVLGGKKLESTCLSPLDVEIYSLIKWERSLLRN